MKKTDYQKPTCEILVVRFEENIMSPKAYRSGGAGQYQSDEVYDNGDY